MKVKQIGNKQRETKHGDEKYKENNDTGGAQL